MKKRIGIVGGGQLGRMLAQAAKKLGFHVTVLDPTPNSPAGQVSDEQIVGDFKDGKMIRELSKNSDYITFEIESANAETLKELVDEGYKINPSPYTLKIIKDKFGQKKFLEEAGIPVALSINIKDKSDLFAAAQDLGYPFLLKSRFDAYDGRGNALIRSEQDIDAALVRLKGPLYAEKFVSFTKELAVVIARDVEGNILSYPVVETIHQNNICHIVLSPAPIPDTIAESAEKLATSIMSHLKGVGVFCIEMFLAEDNGNNKVIVNEIAPRVHNSGHLTIEAHQTSQFEQHIRAISGMPLGDLSRKKPSAVMVNILGERSGTAKPQGIEEAMGIDDVSVHVYGKLETRPERKMGHITALDSDLSKALEKAKTARVLITI